MKKTTYTPKTKFQKNDFVRIKPRWHDPGDDEIPFKCIEDEDRGMVTIMACLGWPVNPCQRVATMILEHDPEA